MTNQPFKLGDRVIKNPATWRLSEFDGWGAGLGTGVIVDPLWNDKPLRPDDDATFMGGGATEDQCVPCVDVRWPKGRAFQRCDELLPAPDGFEFYEFEHKDYVGFCQPDPATGRIYGHVYYISDVVTFRGDDLDSARLAFMDSVEDYLEMCAKQGRVPDNPDGGSIE